MIDNIDRILQIVFVRDQKLFIQTLQKKCKSDYLLNVNKIIREKFEQEILVPNKIQSFLINYEIKKLIDKAVNVRNRKYQRIIYVNSSISSNTILNTIDFLNGAYSDVRFEPMLIDPDNDLSDITGVKTIKKGH
jgi:Na+-transporting methylmalonyl-CoA/oxaloacetate decarboxylase beta subunit